MTPTPRHQTLRDFLDLHGLYPRFVHLLAMNPLYASVAELCRSSYEDSNLIYLAFSWEESSEGYDFWAGISDDFKVFKKSKKERDAT